MSALDDSASDVPVQPSPQGEDEESVRMAAYHLWLEEGQPDGCADRHWAAAREMIRAAGDPHPEGNVAGAAPQGGDAT